MTTAAASTRTSRLPKLLLDRAQAMDVEILDCARDRHGRVYVVAYRGTLNQPYVCWGWDGRGFDSGVYTRDEAGALASLRARCA